MRRVFERTKHSCWDMKSSGYLPFAKRFRKIRLNTKCYTMFWVVAL